MITNKKIYFSALISLYLVYLVIFAGGTVRMTESGMGCPDWPKCFGYYIPPSNISDLEWKKNHSYKIDQIIIKDQSLLVADKDFVSGESIVLDNWKNYTKHDYAEFNATHTWIEFINRLLGALAGLSTLILFIFSINYIKKNKIIFVSSFLVLIGMLFQAWLGKIVVDSNLLPLRVSLHMLMAFLIIFGLTYLLFITSKKTFNSPVPKKIKFLLIFTFILLIFQIIVGTQVRQFIDLQIDDLGQEKKDMWLELAPFKFYFHRSFSTLIFCSNLFIYYVFKKNNWNIYLLNWIMLILIIEIIIGAIMYYFSFPFSTQPIHLLLSAFLFGIQSYFIFSIYNPINKIS
mgnify:FL=1